MNELVDVIAAVGEFVGDKLVAQAYPGGVGGGAEEGDIDEGGVVDGGPMRGGQELEFVEEIRAPAGGRGVSCNIIRQ